MNASCVRCFVFFLLFLTAQGQQIAEQKCTEYRQQTTSKRTLDISLEFEASSFWCSKTVDLLLGGTAVNLGEFPHQALLGYEKRDGSEEYEFRCGGSLISERYVLTAAHCMKFGNPKKVRLGEHNLIDDSDNQVDFDIAEIVRHPDFRNSRSYHDIALVKLSEDVRYSKQIRPACLWTGFPLNTSSVIATGYGLTDIAINKSEVIGKETLNLLDKQECVAQYGRTRLFRNGISEDQLCVGSIHGDKDMCLGDSGGPIQIKTEPRGCIYYIIGVSSMNGDCGRGRSPSIYTRVASYVRWIEEIVWPLER